jgi:6-phosphogluconolactonase
MNVHRYADPSEAADACADYILELIDEALVRKSQASLAVSGGSTPVPMFECFARTQFRWDHVHLFWVDERGVPPTDPQSNFKLANDTWLKPGHFPEANIHRIAAELDPQIAASRYAEEIRAYFGLKPGEMPRFDVIHLGMGPDAHIASLFPGEPLIDNRTDLVAAVRVEKFKQWRVTLLPGVLLAASNKVLLVSGADKVQALRNVFNGPSDPKKFPAQLVRDGQWFMDQETGAFAAGSDAGR